MNTQVLWGQESPNLTTRPFGAFQFQDSVSVPLPPEEAFDRFLEVDEWWDHRFTADPAQFYLDPKPGGGFYEIFPDGAGGVRHATVIYVAKGRSLRLRGPLGMSGYALDMVFSLEFEASTSGEGTLLKLDARGAGELEEGWAAAIQGVWHHFLEDRFLPYCQGVLD
jgi:hypothetical protein